MRIKKWYGFLSVFLALFCVISLAGCSGAGKGSKDGSGDGKDADSTDAKKILAEEPLKTNEKEDDGKLHIGILTYRSHGAAQETVEGFKKELKSMIGDKKVVFDEVSADGDLEKCSQAATEFANNGYKLIFACGTEAVQNAGAAVKDVPVIGACVSDFLLAGVVSSLDSPGANVTGVSCLGPIDEQVGLILRVDPWPTQVGIVSSGTEVGSRFQESVAGQCLEEKQVLWQSYHASTEDGLKKAMERAAAECSSIYLPVDNFVARHMDIVREVVKKTGIFVVTGDYQMCSRGGLCTSSIDYFEHGKKAADMAYSILEKGEEITRLSVQHEDEWQEYYNPVIAEETGWYNYSGMTPLSVKEDDENDKAEEAETGGSK